MPAILEIPTSRLTTVTGGADPAPPQSCDDLFGAWTAAKRANVKDAEGVWAAYATPGLPAAVAQEGRSNGAASTAFKALKEQGCFSFTGEKPR